MFLTISGLNKEGKMPMRRFLLAIIALSALCVKAEESGKSAAETKEAAEAVQSTETATASPVEFYVGVSVGHDRMTAKRTEKTTTNDETLFFSNKKTQSSNSINGKLITGFLWTIPNTAFVLSPEIYIGQGNAQVTEQEKATEPTAPQDVSLHSSYKQKTIMGIILRIGAYLTNKQNDFLYVLLGAEKSKFENKFTYSSAGALGKDTLFEKRNKFLKSPVYGVGFEHKFDRFKIGIDCRYTNYSSWNNYSIEAPVTNDELKKDFKPKIVTTSLTFCYLF